MSLARSRFSGIINQETIKNNSPVHIVGNGGIGSPLSESLAGIGFNLILWDNDKVGEENIGHQKFGFQDIGKPKVQVLKKRLEENYQVRVDAKNEKYEGQTDLRGIVVCGVDSKQARAEIWRFIKMNPFIPFYLDGRVGGERWKLFIVDPCKKESIKKYETHLDLSTPEMETPCTERFSPDAGMALNYFAWTAIKERLLGKETPFLIMGQNFDKEMFYL